MTFAIIGFGTVGKALARTFARKRVEVMVASMRAPEMQALQARDWADRRSRVATGCARGRHRPPGRANLPASRRREGASKLARQDRGQHPKGDDRLWDDQDRQLAIACGLAESVAGTRVTVNAVLPRPTRSEMLSNWMTVQAQAEGITIEQAERAFLGANRPTTLIQRFATTDEVANMIVYACSEQSSATTGAALRVDGGVVRFVA